MADPKEVKRLELLAFDMRKKLINLCGQYDGVVHIGGDLSMTDLLIGLYHHGMNVDPKDIKNPKRDRFILSKGHGAVCMYIAMTLRGYFNYDKIVKTYGQLDSAYGMHPCKIQLPGVECSTGSLGQGLAVAAGMAFSARVKKENHRVFCMMGDGESCEGEVWEAANTASSYKLGNLVGVVDRNRQLMTSFDGEYIRLDPYADKWRAFNWNVFEIDGNNMEQIVGALDKLPPASSEKPTVIIGNTVKGKGVSFMERDIGWHAGALSKADTEKAMASLDANYAELRRS
ncbi:MAG TPA: transketolase [Dehalococcoidales bacterium]|nr:transketolase [Dehalococcoidales bacterium]